MDLVLMVDVSGKIQTVLDYGMWMVLIAGVLALLSWCVYMRCAYLDFKDHQKPAPVKSPDPVQMMDATIKAMPYKDREWMREQARIAGLTDSPSDR